ncbi:MAG: retron system putative HNH endonuclease [Sulfurovum sp.]|nr:retron system putative HNH endonuclease [Sulfurovum sp.]
MRYVQKKSTPSFFERDTRKLSYWIKYTPSKKRFLKEYILENEQYYLCIYCESKVNMDSSHIEHIEPKSLDIKSLTFDYANLSVSCNGTCFNVSNGNSRHNCGHIKKNTYDKQRFLHPCEIIDLEEYFKYDFDDFKIYTTEKNSKKSEYMIKLLNLNSGRLIIARRNDYQYFNKQLKQIKDVEKRKKFIKNKIKVKTLQFISFFRYKYKHLI